MLIPHILEAAGVDLSTSSSASSSSSHPSPQLNIWGTWQRNIQDEVRRRQSLKRSSSEALVSSHTTSDVSDSQSQSWSTVGFLRSNSLAAESSVDGTVDGFTRDDNIQTEMNILWPHERVQPMHPVQVVDPVDHMQLQLVDAVDANVVAGDIFTPDRFKPSTLVKSNSRDTRTMLDTLTKDQVLGVCMSMISYASQLNKKLTDTQKSRKGWYQSSTRLTKRLADAKATIQKLKSPLVTDALQVKQPNTKRLTWRGMVVLGLRKGITLVSANSFPNASLIEVSRQSVTRAEILCGAFLITRAVMFHFFIYTLLRNVAKHRTSTRCGHREGDIGGPSGNVDDVNVTGQIVLAHEQPENHTESLQSQDQLMCKSLNIPPVDDITTFNNIVSTSGHFLGTTFFSGDATNASIWQRQKLQGLLVNTSQITDWTALCREDYDHAFTGLTAMSLVIYFVEIISTLVH